MTPWSEHLYAIVDAELASDPIALAERALSHGCVALQLRAKRLHDDAALELAATIARACKRHRVPFIVNDRPDIAVLVDADGVHLGQDDMPIADARRVLGSRDIGISTHRLAEALEADRAGADRIAFGPVFETSSKANPDPVVGLDQLREVCRSVSRPVVAIGGIRGENVGSVLAAGAKEFAVISALPAFLEALDGVRDQ